MGASLVVGIGERGVGSQEMVRGFGIRVGVENVRKVKGMDFWQETAQDWS